RYYLEALNTPQGQGSQFAVGRLNKQPAFYFSARVGDVDAPDGLVVVVQETRTFRPLFEDTRQVQFVSDEQGVILMGNVPSDLLSRTPLQGLGISSGDADMRIYQRVPQMLNWQVDHITVGGQAVTTVDKPDGSRFMALSRPLDYGGLTAWTLVPREGE